MADYPILEEISNFFLDNLEVFLLVITPLALLGSFIGKKIYERIHSVEDQTEKLLKDQKNDLNTRMDHIEKELDKFDEVFRKDMEKTNNALVYVNTKHDDLYKEFKNVQLDIVTELKVIRALLQDTTVLDNDTVFRKSSFSNDNTERDKKAREKECSIYDENVTTNMQQNASDIDKEPVH